MNFLAHTLLGFDDDALVAGQVAGDFVRGPRLDALPPRIAAGVRLHRSMDAWTDAHEGVAALRARFAPGLRRYAGIAIDVGIDHVIARDWPAFAGPLPGTSRQAHAERSGASPEARTEPSDASLGRHAERVGVALERHRQALPPALNRFAPHLVRTLPGWATPEGVADALHRLSRRSPRMAPLAAAPAELVRLDAELERTVRALWPEAVRHAHDMLAVHAGRTTKR